MTIRTTLCTAALALAITQSDALAQTAPSAPIPEQKTDEGLRAKLPEDIKTAGKLVSVNSGSFPPY
jgi:polar amino acid transport system substrate-binding protein